MLITNPLHVEFKEVLGWRNTSCWSILHPKKDLAISSKGVCAWQKLCLWHQASARSKVASWLGWCFMSIFVLVNWKIHHDITGGRMLSTFRYQRTVWGNSSHDIASAALLSTFAPISCPCCHNVNGFLVLQHHFTSILRCTVQIRCFPKNETAEHGQRRHMSFLQQCAIDDFRWVASSLSIRYGSLSSPLVQCPYAIFNAFQVISCFDISLTPHLKECFLQFLVIDTPLRFPEQLFSLVIEQTFDFDSMGFAVFLQESHVSSDWHGTRNAR